MRPDEFVRFASDVGKATEDAMGDKNVGWCLFIVDVIEVDGKRMPQLTAVGNMEQLAARITKMLQQDMQMATGSEYHHHAIPREEVDGRH